MNVIHPFNDAVWLASSLRGGKRSMAPAPYFRKEFGIDAMPLSAVLSITALGLYEFEVNGQRTGRQALTPGWSDYRIRCYYQQYDLLPSLQTGKNAIGVILGDGWYCGHVGWGQRETYGTAPQFVASLKLTFSDSRVIVINSDESWLTSSGPLLENDLLMGETYDARLEFGAWSGPHFDASEWKSPIAVKAPAIELNHSIAPSVQRNETLIAKDVKEIFNGPFPVKVFDFAQNFSGRTRIRVKAKAGATITLRFGEALKEDGTIYTENLRGARATDHYTCKGSDWEEWEPLFTFHGFRYAEVAGVEETYELEIVGIVLYSGMDQTGDFRCSNPLLIQLQSNILWGLKSNFLDIPTDCPQRDERLGWTGDAQVFMRTACFNMDARLFFHKWIRDLQDAQSENGGLSCVVPTLPHMTMEPFEDGGPGWSDAAVICPWTLYLCYGDKEILAQAYGMMAKVISFITDHRSVDLIRSHPEGYSWGGYGDWLALDGSGFLDGGTPKDLIGTAFYAYITSIMAKVAAVLGRAEDETKYRDLFGKIRRSFQHRYLTPAGFLASGTQTAYVLALHFDLIPPQFQAICALELVRDIERRKDHLATGFLGTPYLLRVLEDHGYLDVAYRLLEQETFPSWLYPVKNGATTIWERWDGWSAEKGMQDKGMNSFNHYAYGAVGEWMYRSVAGLDMDPSEPGFRKIIFRPRPGGSLNWAEAALDTPLGKTGIRWSLSGDELELELVVPPGATATFEPPKDFSAEMDVFESGVHRVIARRENALTKPPFSNLPLPEEMPLASK